MEGNDGGGDLSVPVSGAVAHCGARSCEGLRVIDSGRVGGESESLTRLYPEVGVVLKRECSQVTTASGAPSLSESTPDADSGDDAGVPEVVDLTSEVAVQEVRAGDVSPVNASEGARSSPALDSRRSRGFFNVHSMDSMVRQRVLQVGRDWPCDEGSAERATPSLRGQGPSVLPRAHTNWKVNHIQMRCRKRAAQCGASAAFKGRSPTRRATESVGPASAAVASQEGQPSASGVPVTLVAAGSAQTRSDARRRVADSFAGAPPSIYGAVRLQGARQGDTQQQPACPSSDAATWDEVTRMLRLPDRFKLPKIKESKLQGTLVKVTIDQLYMDSIKVPEVTHNAGSYLKMAKCVLVRYVFMHCLYKKMGFVGEYAFLQSGTPEFYGRLFPQGVVQQWNDKMTKDLAEIFDSFNSSSGAYYLGDVLGGLYCTENSRRVETNPENSAQTRPDLLGFALEHQNWTLVNVVYRCTKLYEEHVYRPNKGDARRLLISSKKTILDQIRKGINHGRREVR